MAARLGHCAQQVCVHFASRLGLDDAQAVGMGAAFGTGMGHADVCGCISGAHIVLGLRYASAAKPGGRAAQESPACAEGDGI